LPFYPLIQLSHRNEKQFFFYYTERPWFFNLQTIMNAVSFGNDQYIVERKEKPMVAIIHS